MIKKTLLGLLVFGFASTLSADTMFNYSALKEKSVKSEKLRKEKNIENTQQYIEDKYNTSLDKQSVKDIYLEQNRKTLEIGFVFRAKKEYKKLSSELVSGVYTDTYVNEGQSNYGLSINGLIDLISIGKNYKNVYGNIQLFDDQVFLGFEKRWLLDDMESKGLLFGIGAGVIYQTKDTIREKSDNQFYSSIRLGYNFDDWGIQIKTTIPSDFSSRKPNSKENIGSTTSFEIGWRF